MDVERRAISVLHVMGVLTGDRGGATTATLAIAEATSLAGDRATILTTVAPGDDLDAVRSLTGVDLVTAPRHAPRHVSMSLPLVGWLWRHVREHDLVEVHEVFAFPTVATRLVCRLRGVPMVVHPHGSLEPYDMRKHARVKALLRPALRRLLTGSAAVWLTAQREADNLAHLGGGITTVVTPLPVRPDRLCGDRAAFRARYGLDGSDRVVLFLGRLDPKKGIDRLVEAFERVRDDDERVRLVVAGGGDPGFVATVEHRLASSRHAASVRTTGFVAGQDRADAFAGADLFCLHSDRENFGIAPVEAAGAGLPALLSDEVYVGDDLAAAGAAVVVAATDVAALAGAMARLLADDAELARLATAARAAGAGFAPERVAELDAGVRRGLLGSRPRS
ncbi:glycosyltransferase [Pseudonocardia sp. ICBG1122]|nr:glycosyltransferase [Pseudonocardia pini]